MEWTKASPTKEGWYLRFNTLGKIQLHYVSEKLQGMHFIGFGGELVNVEKLKGRGFQWLGPIEIPKSPED